MSKSQNIFRFPANILTPSLMADTDRDNPLMQAVKNELSEQLDGVEPFFWPAEISSTRLDSYFTHMAESTLRNFASDAADGRTFLDSHDSGKLGFGQSYDGRVEINNGLTRVVAGFYTVPGIRFGGNHSYESTDDFIMAVKTRLARDVSVGFYGGEHVCDICGGNYFDASECPHFPGVKYPVGDQGNQVVVCTLTIEDARLSEVSAVYDGATPEAMILKAERMNKAGDLDPKVAESLRTQYRIKLPEPVSRFAGVDIKDKRSKQTMNELEAIRAALQEAAVKNAEKVVEGVQELIDRANALQGENDKLTVKVTELQPLADDGRAYRGDLVEEALAEGVRAMGDEFPMETYRGMLESAGLDHIKQVRDTLKAQGDKNFPGGRQTADETETPEPEGGETEEVSVVPDSAYAA